MFIKKVGYLLLVRLKLFQLAVRLAPVALLASFFLIFFITPLKEQYKFQQPSLRTKIFDVDKKKTNPGIDYQPVYDGVSYALIEGLMVNECLLLAYPQSNQQSIEIRNIYWHLTKEPHLSKNVVLVSYESISHLQTFFDWYYDSNRNHELSFGIIRAGLNIQIHQNRQNSSKQDKLKEKDKAYFKIYSPSIHPDIDYFMSIKQLIQQLQFSWSPCEYIHRSRQVAAFKKGFTFIEQQLTRQSQLRLFIDNVLCEFYEHAAMKLSAHEVMMTNGFQAGTVKFVVNSAGSNKVEEVVVSFIKEFGMQEDHLHSASPFFYPFSRSHFLPQLSTLYPSLLFFIALVIKLIDQFIKNGHKNQLQLRLSYVFFAFIALNEYSMAEDYLFSLTAAIIYFICSIGLDLEKILTKSHQNQEQSVRCYYQITFIAIEGLVSIYFGVFCFSLSIIAMSLTTIMLLKPKSPLLKLVIKLLIILLAIFSIYSAQILTFHSLKTGQSLISPHLKVTLVLPLLHFTL